MTEANTPIVKKKKKDRVETQHKTVLQHSISLSLYVDGIQVQSYKQCNGETVAEREKAMMAMAEQEQVLIQAARRLVEKWDENCELKRELDAKENALYALEEELKIRDQHLHCIAEEQSRKNEEVVSELALRETSFSADEAALRAKYAMFEEDERSRLRQATSRPVERANLAAGDEGASPRLQDVGHERLDEGEESVLDQDLAGWELQGLAKGSACINVIYGYRWIDALSVFSCASLQRGTCRKF